MDTMQRIEAIREAFWRLFGDRLRPRDLVALEFKTIETRTARDSALLAIVERIDGNTDDDDRAHARKDEPYFCCGDFCPGYHYQASVIAHPARCAIEALNSARQLHEAAASRRAHGRDVFFFTTTTTTTESP